MFEKFLEDKKKDFLSHIRLQYQEIVDSKRIISLQEYVSMRMNSYEDKYIEPCLSDEALVWKIETALKNTRDNGHYYIPIVYDDYLKTDAIRELLKRFKLTII